MEGITGKQKWLRIFIFCLCSYISLDMISTDSFKSYRSSIFESKNCFTLKKGTSLYAIIQCNVINATVIFTVSCVNLTRMYDLSSIINVHPKSTSAQYIYILYINITYVLL